MTNLIAVEDIVISPKRQRREFDPRKMRELGDSLENKAVGLMHPIVLRREGEHFILVAGERRLRQITDSHDLCVPVYHAGEQIPDGQIPYTDIGEMAYLDAWEAELDENIRRTDLTMQERAQATAELMALRTAQAEAKGEIHPSVADLAEEIEGRSDGYYHSKTRQELIVAKHLDDPDVQKAKDLGSAIKIIKRKEESKRNATLAREIGRTLTSNSHTVLNADSGEWIRSCPDNTFDVVLTDPPYGMDADTFGDSGGMAAGGHGYEDSAENLQAILRWLPEQLFRVTKPQAHLYLFCDIDWFFALRGRFEAAGWKVFRTPIIWHKPSGFRMPWPDMGPQRRYETCMYAVKGDKRATKIGGDVIACPPDDNLGHMAQKPVSLYVDLLSRSVIPGDKVLDLFAGTGTIIPAAHALLCHATAVERDPASYGICAQRAKDLG